MANSDFNNDDSGNRSGPKGTKNPKAGPLTRPMPMKTASWGALPGGTQSKDRSGGTPTLKIYPTSKGLKG